MIYPLDELQNEKESKKSKLGKRTAKAKYFLRAVAEKVGLPIHEVYQKAGIILEEKVGLYEGFEKVLKEGTEALTKLEIPEDIAKAFAEVAEERIHIKLVKVRGILEIRCMKPNGVKCIQDAFIDAKERTKS